MRPDPSPNGYRAAISFEQQPPGLCAHLSISVDTPGNLPSPESVEMIAEVFGLKVPLAPDDRDTVLDLQATFARAFDQGNFAARTDYTRDPSARMTDAHRQWIGEWLRQMRLR